MWYLETDKRGWWCVDHKPGPARVCPQGLEASGFLDRGAATTLCDVLNMRDYGRLNDGTLGTVLADD